MRGMLMDGDAQTRANLKPFIPSKLAGPHRRHKLHAANSRKSSSRTKPMRRPSEQGDASYDGATPPCARARACHRGCPGAAHRRHGGARFSRQRGVLACLLPGALLPSCLFHIHTHRQCLPTYTYTRTDNAYLPTHARTHARMRAHTHARLQTMKMVSHDSRATKCAPSCATRAPPRPCCRPPARSLQRQTLRIRPRRKTQLLGWMQSSTQRPSFAAATTWKPSSCSPTSPSCSTWCGRAQRLVRPALPAEPSCSAARARAPRLTRALLNECRSAAGFDIKHGCRARRWPSAHHGLLHHSRLECSLAGTPCSPPPNPPTPPPHSPPHVA
jgi:hypothetical protein